MEQSFILNHVLNLGRADLQTHLKKQTTNYFIT